MLGVERGQVALLNADTARVPDSGVQGASRAVYWVGGAVVQAAETLRHAVTMTAAEMLDCDPAELAFGAGGVAACGGRQVPLAAVAAEMERVGVQRRVRGAFDLTAEFGGSDQKYTPHVVTAAHAALVEADTHTGQARVVRHVAAHDVGRAVNPPDAQGQIEGAVLMGIGAALYEEYRPGVTTGLTSYIVPMVGEVPDIEAVLVEVPGYRGPFGAKGLGETPMLPSTPAVINALSRALGRRVRTIPATPERVLAALREATGEG